MFPVNRFDPRTEQLSKKKSSKRKQTKKNQKSSKKRSRKGVEEDENEKKKPSTLRVIAPEVKQPIHSKRQRTDEAMDDFDITEPIGDLIEGNESNEKVEEKGSIVDEEASEPVSPEVATALRMSSLPIREAAQQWNLAPFLIDNLERDGYESFFPIQSLVIPDVIASEHHSRILQVRDVCVAAPTGSGKTLAFCMPVLNSLSTRIVRRLRALIILPSRDLARQVYDVFSHYSQGSNLQIGLAIGQSDFKNEQKALIVGETDGYESTERCRYRHTLDPHNLDLALRAFPPDQPKYASRKPVNFPGGGHSAIDVLVATPGRLVDHLDKTPGFTLQHLRFLVIDEADRLVSQSYHSFVRRIMESVHSPSEKRLQEPLSSSSSCSSSSIDPISWRRPRHGIEVDIKAFDSIQGSVCQKVQLRKLLFSATLTKDPQKLAGLGLVNPKHYDTHHLRAGQAAGKQYSMPDSLLEYTIECTAEQKPLILLAVLLEQLQSEKESVIVVFTSSIDSTHRLVRLLQLLWGSARIGEPSRVAEFSSGLSQTQRSHLVQQCQQNKVSVVVCSDGMSRGMDISGVGTVVNYDVPRFAKTYVHRCGRTARAGRSGKAVSLLKGGQIGQFRKMRSIVEDPSRMQVMPVKKELVRTAFSKYKSCISRLRDVIGAEEDGDIDKTAALPSTFFE